MMQYIFTFILALFISACSTMEVANDYDPSFDYKQIKTFAIVHKTTPLENSLIDDRIKAALIKTLTKKGLVKVDKTKADMIVLYHINVQDKTQIYTDYQMVGYGRYGGMVVATPRTYNYHEGKLIIDLYDPKINKTIYRSVVVDELKKLKTPQEKEAYINQVIQKAFENFPPKM